MPAVKKSFVFRTRSGREGRRRPTVKKSWKRPMLRGLVGDGVRRFHSDDFGKAVGG